MLFPVENFYFGRPKTNFSCFEKLKAKKKTKNKNKKKSSSHFVTFPPSIFNFPPSFLQFSFFSSPFSPLYPFFLTSFFPIGQQKFPGPEVCGGALCPPLPPACYATDADMTSAICEISKRDFVGSLRLCFSNPCSLGADILLHHY